MAVSTLCLQARKGFLFIFSPSIQIPCGMEIKSDFKKKINDLATICSSNLSCIWVNNLYFNLHAFVSSFHFFLDCNGAIIFPLSFSVQYILWNIGRIPIRNYTGSYSCVDNFPHGWLSSQLDKYKTWHGDQCCIFAIITWLVDKYWLSDLTSAYWAAGFVPSVSC